MNKITKAELARRFNVNQSRINALLSGENPKIRETEDGYIDLDDEFNKKYIEDLINIGELPYNEVRPYMIKRYEQILVNFNLAIGKQVYKNVKYDPDWIDDLEGL